MVVSWHIDYGICIGVLFGVIRRVLEVATEDWANTLFQRVPYFWVVRLYSNTTSESLSDSFSRTSDSFFPDLFKNFFFWGPHFSQIVSKENFRWHSDPTQNISIISHATDAITIGHTHQWIQSFRSVAENIIVPVAEFKELCKKKITELLQIIQRLPRIGFRACRKSRRALHRNWTFAFAKGSRKARSVIAAIYDL